MPQNAEDLYTMSLDELKALALQADTTQQDETVQPVRDQQGRFTKAQEQQDEQAQDTGEDDQEVVDITPKKKVFRRVVTVAEGVDPEVFEADSLEELVDKMADAKAHATRKIREQEASLKKYKEQEAPKPRTFTEDEEYVYSQELYQKPTQAFAKMFREMTGMDITQFRSVADKVNAYEAGVSRNNAISTFITTHPDYEDNERNRDLMTLAMQGREVTAENLEKAYLNLSAKGLLDTGKGTQSSEQDDEEQTKTGITSQASTKAPPQGTKKSSGLSTKSRPPVQVKNTGPSEDELYDRNKYSLEQIKEMAIRNAAR